ncbi:MAG: dihydrofolate reductase [Chitinophagaceae bacterium]|nr:MAG: dihydrofolate reductase [Chitinophagaceae bacterium]
MRNITILSMITLDGVMQAPGGPDEDLSGGFQYGGWVAPYNDANSSELMQRLMKPSDLLLGRKTFDIWEAYWPQHADAWPGVNEVTKYVLSTTRKESGWQNSVFLNSLEGIRQLKASEGASIQVWGSSELVQLLLQHDLADDLWLFIHPLLLGKGKKLFGDTALPAAYKLEESVVSGDGVILAHYQRAGEVKTGTVGA